MNLKNHSGERYVVLQGEQNEVSAFSPGHTFPWYCKTLPTLTNGRLATYLLGFIITVADLAFTVAGGEGNPTVVDADDIGRALFESFELKNTMFGKPISHNYYKGSFLGLGGFIGNGMRRPIPMPALFAASTTPFAARLNYYVPASALLGSKGHHTAQLCIAYDGATFETKTASAGQVGGVTITSANLMVTAVLVSEPEIRLGPGTQFVRYEQTTGGTATKHMIEALGNTSSLSGVDTGAGIAFLAWMTSKKGHGGSFINPKNLEYINVPFRGLDQVVNLDALFSDYLGAGEGNDIPANLDLGGYGGGFAMNGSLYDFDKREGDLRDGALFVPLISPKRFLEVTKLQTVEGTQEVNAKITGESFEGQDVYYALQYHSWTPALQEQFLRKVVDSGLARAVWGTNDLQPKTKLLNKQPAGSVNLAKTRYLPLTWEPKEQVVNPPGPASAK